jgi:hypothetical protein
MDYIDPAPNPPRDEPIKPLSPEEAVIAANLYQSKVLANLFATLQGGQVPTWASLNICLPLTTTNTNEKEDFDPRHN